MIARHGIRAYLVLLTFVLIGCESAEHKAERARQEQDVKSAREVANLSSHYGAVTDWQQALKDRSFSIDIEPIFVRSDHRPILFYATLEDIRKENNDTAIYFRSFPTENEPTFQLVLDCLSCDLQALRKSSQSIGDFAVIAEPTSVVKLIDGSNDSPDFVLKGKFIDAQFVNDYDLHKSIK